MSSLYYTSHPFPSSNFPIPSMLPIAAQPASYAGPCPRNMYENDMQPPRRIPEELSLHSSAFDAPPRTYQPCMNVARNDTAMRSDNKKIPLQYKSSCPFINAVHTLSRTLMYKEPTECPFIEAIRNIGSRGNLKRSSPGYEDNYSYERDGTENRLNGREGPSKYCPRNVNGAPKVYELAYKTDDGQENSNDFSGGNVERRAAAKTGAGRTQQRENGSMDDPWTMPGGACGYQANAQQKRVNNVSNSERLDPRMYDNIRPMEYCDRDLNSVQPQRQAQFPCAYPQGNVNANLGDSYHQSQQINNEPVASNVYDRNAGKDNCYYKCIRPCDFAEVNNQPKQSGQVGNEANATDYENYDMGEMQKYAGQFLEDFAGTVNGNAEVNNQQRRTSQERRGSKDAGRPGDLPGLVPCPAGVSNCYYSSTDPKSRRVNITQEAIPENCAYQSQNAKESNFGGQEARKQCGRSSQQPPAGTQPVYYQQPVPQPRGQFMYSDEQKQEMNECPAFYPRRYNFEPDNSRMRYPETAEDYPMCGYPERVGQSGRNVYQQQQQLPGMQFAPRNQYGQVPNSNKNDNQISNYPQNAVFCNQQNPEGVYQKSSQKDNCVLSWCPYEQRKYLDDNDTNEFGVPQVRTLYDTKDKMGNTNSSSVQQEFDKPFDRILDTIRRRKSIISSMCPAFNNNVAMDFRANVSTSYRNAQQGSAKRPSTSCPKKSDGGKVKSCGKCPKKSAPADVGQGYGCKQVAKGACPREQTAQEQSKRVCGTTGLMSTIKVKLSEH